MTEIERELRLRRRRGFGRDRNVSNVGSLVMLRINADWTEISKNKRLLRRLIARLRVSLVFSLKTKKT